MATKAGFNNGEKKQKFVHFSAERILFIFYAVYTIKNWKATGSIRKVYTRWTNA